MPVSEVSSTLPSPLKGVVRRFAALASASVAGQIIGFLALAYVTRRIGAANLGAYTIASTMVGYAGIVANAGVSYKATLDIARGAEDVRGIVREAVVLQCSLAVCVYVAMVAAAPILTSDPVVRQMLPILALVPLLSALTLDWPIVALGETKELGIWRVIGQLAYAVPIPFLIGVGVDGALRYAGMNMVGLAVTAAGVFLTYRRFTHASPTKLSPRALGRRLTTSLPFALVLVLLQVLSGIAALTLGILDSTRAVGLFAVAYKLPGTLPLLAGAWLSAFFPHATKEIRADRVAFAHQLGRALSVAVVIALGIAAGGIACAGTIVPVLFGHAFSDASVPFAFLSVSAGFLVIQVSVTEGVLLALDSQRYYVVMLALAVPIVLVAEIIGVVTFGVDGAAAAAILVNAYLAAGGLIEVRRKLGGVRVDLAIITRGAVSVGTMVTGLIIAARWGLAVQLGAGAAGLIAGGWATGFLRAL